MKIDLIKLAHALFLAIATGVLCFIAGVLLVCLFLAYQQEPVEFIAALAFLSFATFVFYRIL